MRYIEKKKRTVIQDHIDRIVTYQGDRKKRFINRWGALLKSVYSKYNQFGICVFNNNLGVLTPSGKWSPINQFNTNYMINVMVCDYINKKITKDFFSKGITEFNGKKIKTIKFENLGFDDSYIDEEIDNIFYWLEIFKDEIFVNLNNVPYNSILYQLISEANRIMCYGMYGEICLQYHLLLRNTPTNVYRTSSVRGSSDDMINGYDIYTIHKETNVVSKFQVKTCKIFDGLYTNKKIDTGYYKKNGVGFLALVDTRSEIVVLRIDGDILEEKEKNKFYINENLIVMREPINELLKNEICFELFVYCSKKDLTFNLEIGDNSKIDFNKDSNEITLTLPSSLDNYNQSSIVDGWKNIINQIEVGEEKETSLKNLEKFIK